MTDAIREALKEAIDVFEGMNDDEINLELLPRLKAALASPAVAREAVAWIAQHPDRGFNFATMADTRQGASSRLMMTEAGNRGYTIIPLYATLPSEAAQERVREFEEWLTETRVRAMNSAAETRKLAADSWGSGYDTGYSDALEHVAIHAAQSPLQAQPGTRGDYHDGEWGSGCDVEGVREP